MYFLSEINTEKEEARRALSLYHACHGVLSLLWSWESSLRPLLLQFPLGKSHNLRAEILAQSKKLKKVSRDLGLWMHHIVVELTTRVRGTE